MFNYPIFHHKTLKYLSASLLSTHSEPMGSQHSQESIIYDSLLSQPVVISFKFCGQFEALCRNPVVNGRASFILKNKF